MIEFEIEGSVAKTIRKDGKITTKYVTQWFNAAYDTKTKKAFYLRAGGVQGADLELPAELVKAITD